MKQVFREYMVQKCVWHGCYDQQLRDVIVPEAYQHPAKMSWALAQRIMAHVAESWPWVETVFDPMAGVGVVGLAAAYAGYWAVLGELEAHFATLARHNVAKHRERLEALGKPVPVVIRHDARHIPLAPATEVVTSPPYATTIQHAQNGIDYSKCVGRDGRIWRDRRRESAQYGNFSYGEDARQIGNLRAVVTSPPYATGDTASARNIERRTDASTQWIKRNTGWRTGYGDHPEQLGNVRPDDYWSAMAQVYIECARILPAGAPLIVVVKGYVQKGAYVDLPRQTAEMLEQCGFEVVHWHEASLVARESQLNFFGGEQRKSRKSFFRRLAEKNGAPAIDAEVVLCAEKSKHA